MANLRLTVDPIQSLHAMIPAPGVSSLWTGWFSGMQRVGYQFVIPQVYSTSRGMVYRWETMPVDDTTFIRLYVMHSGFLLSL